MFSFLVNLTLAASLGPMGPDAPAREPQMASQGSTLALTFGAGRRIYFSASADGGETFSAPMKVAEAEILPLTRHRGPRIVISGHTIVISAVIGRTAAEGAHAHGLPSDGDLVAWRSTNGGASWSQGTVINDVPAAATEGLHALAADAKGNIFAVWLDKRGGHGTKLYGARSSDGGRTWSSNVIVYQSVDGTICECCHPSVAIDSGGQITVMWRNWLGGSRDMYIVRSKDGISFSQPEKLGTGTWQLNACPMDGGGLAVSGTRVVTAWRREHEIFLASPGEKEVGIGEGVDVAISAAQKRVYVVWSTPSGIRALLPGEKEPVALSSQGTFPSVSALLNGGAVIAWEDAGTIRTKRISPNTSTKQ